MTQIRETSRFQLETRFGIVPVEIRRNPRRRTRMGFAFEATGNVVVDAPVQAPIDDIHTALREHARWIGYRSSQARNDLNGWAAPRFDDGELHYYLGDRYLLRLGAQRTALENGELQLAAQGAGDARDLLRRWYQRRADAVLGTIVTECADRAPWVDQTPPWRHRFMRSQWGSCSARGHVSLNTHLVKIPEPLIEYVVMHELCHLKHLNHSRRFYALLSAHVKDWEVRRRALSKYTGFLAGD